MVQEERWDVKGAHQELEVRWTNDNGRIDRVTEMKAGFCRRIEFGFVDDSRVVIDFPRAARQSLLDVWGERS